MKDDCGKCGESTNKRAICKECLEKEIERLENIVRGTRDLQKKMRGEIQEIRLTNHGYQKVIATLRDQLKEDRVEFQQLTNEFRKVRAQLSELQLAHTVNHAEFITGDEE